MTDVIDKILEENAIMEAYENWLTWKDVIRHGTFCGELLEAGGYLVLDSEKYYTPIELAYKRCLETEQ